MMPFAAQPIPISAGDSVDDRAAAFSADDLTRAFAEDLTPPQRHHRRAPPSRGIAFANVACIPVTRA
jgi:hypothetical protein